MPRLQWELGATSDFDATGEKCSMVEYSVIEPLNPVTQPLTQMNWTLNPT